MILFDFDIQERMEFQRKLLKKVNFNCSFTHPLNGLSASAIDTWVKNNRNISPNLIYSLKKLSDSLLVLSTKSQESIDVQDLNLESLQAHLTQLENYLNKI